MPSSETSDVLHLFLRSDQGIKGVVFQKKKKKTSELALWIVCILVCWVFRKKMIQPEQSFYMVRSRYQTSSCRCICRRTGCTYSVFDFVDVIQLFVNSATCHTALDHGFVESADALLALFHSTGVPLPPMRAQSSDLRTVCGGAFISWTRSIEATA